MFYLDVRSPIINFEQTVTDTQNGAQSEEKNYVDRVRNSKEILLVGINYTDKEHTCIIERYQ